LSMRKGKILLAALLVFTFLLGTFSEGFAADTKISLSEVARAQALGILKGDEQGNLHLDKPITRAEALTLIVRISGMEGAAEIMKGETKFTDVTSDAGLQWATGYINLGVSQNIISGYPDGTFRGNDQVSYAEMAKMILYAMNYGVALQGAPWPSGVMNKAVELNIFDGVNILPNTPAIRGDVVKMIDNSLTVSHLTQTGFGENNQYEEDKGKTFLSKLGVTELKGYVVTEIAKVKNSRLDDNEILVVKYDMEGNEEDVKILTLKADINPETVFGLKVDLWVDDNDEVFFIKEQTEGKEVIVDTVSAGKTVISTVDGKQALSRIAFYIADKSYEVSDGAEFYINNKRIDIKGLPADYNTPSKLEGLFGKVILERGSVVFANLFDFSDDKGIVTKAEDTIIEFVDLSARKDEIDLGDYDFVYVYNYDLTAAKVEDIKKDSHIAFWKDNDDAVYIVVTNKKVEGSLDRIKNTVVTVDGENYDRATPAIASLNTGKDFKPWSGIDDIGDLADEKVILLLDYNGEAAAIYGDVEISSDTIYGIVTYAKVERNGVITLFNKDGEDVDYTVEERATISAITHGDSFDYFKEYYEDGFGYAIAALRLNKDGKIGENAEDFKYVTVNTNNVVIGDAAYNGELEKEADKSVFTLGAGRRFYITKDTVIMKALDSTDKDLEPELIPYSTFLKLNVGGPNNKAVVFGEAGKNAELIVLLDAGFKGESDDYFYGVVTESTWLTSGNKYTAEIDVAGYGKQEYIVDDRSVFQNGAIVTFKMNSKNEATAKAYQRVNADAVPADGKVDGDQKLIEGIVDEVDGSFIRIKGATIGEDDVYKVADDAVIYNIKFDDGFKRGDRIRMSKIDPNDKVTMLLDKDYVVRAMVVYYEEDI